MIVHKACFLLSPTLYQPLTSQKIGMHGNSLAVQWLGVDTFAVGARIQFLVGEIRSHKPSNTAPKKVCMMKEWW